MKTLTGGRMRSAIAIAIFTMLFSLVLAAPTPGTEAQSSYGYEQRHDYRSSVDGATLPCSIFKPDPQAVLDAGGDPAKIPLWVELHPFSAHGFLTESGYDTANMFVLSPWGRNYKGMYADGKEVGTPEPCIFDDFSASATAWTAESGSWSVQDGRFVQNAADDNLHIAGRSDSNGANYTVSVDVMELPAPGDTFSAMGIVFRRQPNGECYVVGMVDHTNSGKGKRLCLYRYDDGAFIPLAEDELEWADNLTYNLKVHVFEDTIEVHVNNYLWSLDNSLTFHNDDSLAGRCEDATFPSGGVGLISMGGTHYFDNFRVQNEFLYGETDAIDCINQFLEEFSADPNYRVDPSRIYLSGFSMGGVGTWNLGLHNPDLFSALHPAFGATDLLEGYNWINTYYPDDPPSRTIWFWIFPFVIDYKIEQDGHISEACESFMHGAPGTNTLIDSTIKEYSARWILENALNTPMRIEHAEYDSLLPNVVLPLNPVNNFLCVFWLCFTFPGANMSYNNLTPGYAQSDYVWKKWQSVTGLTACRQETSGYGEDGQDPPPPNPSAPYEPSTANIWDNYNYSREHPYGSHGAADRNQSFVDFSNATKMVKFFNRSTAAYGDLHVNPPEVAYKTYDGEHDGAWWLSLDIAYPDQNNPGLARVMRDTSTNSAAVHVKNVEVTTLDLIRMGLDNSSGKTLTISVDGNTAPESEPLADTWKKTDLELLGNWWPGLDYTVKLNGADMPYTVSGTAMSINNIPTATPGTITITVPSGTTNLLTNPGFEDGGAYWFGGNQYNGGAGGIFDVVDASATGLQAHGGNRSVRIKDAMVNSAPFISSWNSTLVQATGGRSYTASVFVKTRVLQGQARKYTGGKYDPVYTSNAGVGILWFNAQGAAIRYDESKGIHDTNDWTPLELTVTSPADAAYAQLILFVRNPDRHGSSGSAWFDDVALR